MNEPRRQSCGLLLPLTVLTFLGRVSRICFLLIAMEGLADPLNNWAWRFPHPQGNILEGVTYGAGQFIAVGDNGTIITSTDGFHWSNQVSGTSVCLRGVAYTNGEYAAVGDNGVILISTNGGNWSQVPAITTNRLRAISSGFFGTQSAPVMQFLAAGDSGTVVASDNGTNWYQVSSGTSNNLYGVTWRYATYYTVVGTDGTVLKINNAHIRQIASTNVGTTGNLYAVATDGNLAYVAGGDLNGTLFTSSFGTNEILYSDVSGYVWGNIDWLNGVGESPPYQTLWYLSEYFIITGMTCGAAGFVAVGYTGYDLEYHPAVVLTAPDGVTWTELPSSICEDGLNAVAYGNGMYVGVGDFGSIAVSTNATNWTEVLPDRRGFIVAMACNSNLCIVTAANIYYSWRYPDFSVLVSTNASDWVVPAYAPTSLSDLACSSAIFVGVSGTAICTTTNGYNWQTNSVTTNSLHGVKHANGLFFAVGDNGAIYSSGDGLNWTNVSLTNAGSFYAMDYGNGVYVCAGNIAATSLDGVAWSLAPSNSPEPICKIAYGDGLFVGASYSGVILTSSNGLNWQVQYTNPNGEAFSGVAFCGGVFLAISGKSGATFESGDGVIWQATGSTLPSTQQGYDGYESYYTYSRPMPLGLFGYYEPQFPGCYSSVCACNGTFLIGGAEGMIFQSGILPPLISTPRIVSNLLSLYVNVWDGVSYRIQASSNLLQWTDVYSSTSSGQPVLYTETISNAVPARFFRVISGN